mmetsp:Transcript_27553/g.49137  ORF Transcript_27553/g.49137 Transcript_27553/m.49137 type:complete len:174 (-) Transcript_27553:225-746(-)
MALAFKVATFTMKTLAKPLASRFQGWMLSHPYWRERCINLAQAIHRAEVRVTRGAEGKEGKAFVGTMTEEKALDLASKIVSEGFIYTFGAGILAYEYVSSRRKDVAKALATEQQKRREMERAVRERAQLQEMNEQQNMIIASLAARLEMLEERLQEDHAKRQRRFFGLLPGSA